jgi:hypothetical protein
VAVLSRADLKFCGLAEKWFDFQGSLEQISAYDWSAAERVQLHVLASNLLDEIRARRSDLDLRPLATFIYLDFSNLPPPSDLVLLARDATDIVAEAYHAVTTGRVNEHIKLTRPVLLENGRHESLEVTRRILGDGRGYVLVEFLSKQSDDKAHVDEIVKGLDGVRVAVGPSRRRTLLRLYYRTAKVLDERDAPIRLSLHKNVIRLSWSAASKQMSHRMSHPVA